MDTEVLGSALLQLKDRMGINYDDDDELLKNALKSAENWLINDILYDETYVIKQNTTALSLIIERARYDMMNSLDIFPKNYSIDIGQVIARHEYDSFRKENG